MFVKVTKSKNFSYVQLVESFRDKGKIKHRVLLNLGRLDLLTENNQLAKISKKLLELSGEQCFIPEDIKEISRLKYGHLAYKVLWDKLDIGSIVDELLKKTKITFNLIDTIFYLTANRLLESSSKKKAYERQNNYYQLDSKIKLQHIYSCLLYTSPSPRDRTRSRMPSSA